ncbi:hypothetical protein NKR23_g714 [Pleurostoma richardsiae]|uniref:Uncharacterized protein n=1 Tax=Pleurostoma richardsiae TaxID=41990 RepID=A0AA38SD20_9PEZI|nr:hypothetical protein NKR23_g714 [Pleurostoma richardsiae]
MPRFPVAFGRRKSSAAENEHGPVEPSFRVIERSELSGGGGKAFDGGARLSAKTHHMPTTSVTDIPIEENIFADLKTNRGSGSSNTTKTTSTDNSSRHSNASTAPSSADFGGQEEMRGHKKAFADIPVPPVPKSSGSGFLRSAGRTFSFGGQKKQLPPVPAVVESLPNSPVEPEGQTQYNGGRARATTSSTATTVTPPKVDEDFALDLGSDFGKMLSFDKRASVATVLDDQGRQALAPRSLTGNRLNQPSPIHIDKTSKVEPSPFSWNSQRSHDGLLSESPVTTSPTNENVPPPVPRHTSPVVSRKPLANSEGSLKRSSAVFGRRKSEIEDGDDEDAKLLKDSLSAVSKFMASGGGAAPAQSSRYRRNDDAPGKSWRDVSLESKEDDDLFDTNLKSSTTLAQRYVSQRPSPPRNKVMTRAQFERYREDLERQDNASDSKESDKDESEDEDHYDDDDDEIEKSRQLAKQRKKQEAHMTVYRQQMMKVTGESSSLPPRPSLQISMSTPNLPNLAGGGPSNNASSPDSDSDEEVPLAILAAHGFPNKNRPPTRLSSMISNPNLRAATQPSFQRPGSAMGEASADRNSRLPVFARNLPQDPYGLVKPSVRESFALGGGSPVPGQAPPVPPGGLVGVIANEERSRAMRRGTPQLNGTAPIPAAAPGGFDPINGIPPQMMYPQMPNMMLSPGDQAQLQMTQQMTQFMQMQMQFMQMMAANGANPNGPPRSAGHMSAQSMGSVPNMNGINGMNGMNGMSLPMPVGMDGGMRNSFMDNGSMLNAPRGSIQSRTMSMVQPSSASWVQPPPPPQQAGFAPSIRVVGNGYAPSIAPSERSNIGLPGRYRPVSHAPPTAPSPSHMRNVSTMSGAIGGWEDPASVRKAATKTPPLKKAANNASDDEDEGWEAMKAKRDKKKSLWKSKKSSTAQVPEISALIT